MSGIYIHIPFCKQKCIYCNFYSVGGINLKDDFIRTLLKEIDLKQNYLKCNNINTIYFGGGTPSLLSCDEINIIIEKIEQYFSVSNNAEITLEANPDDLTKEYLKELFLTKINRLSIGVQSFNDNALIYLNRRHNSQRAIKAIEDARNVGFTNFSIDLIYGIPNQNDFEWVKNLDKANELVIPHLSCYALTVEEQTPLFQKISKYKIASPNDEDSMRQFDILMDFAENNNYLQYEISNFCKDNKLSKHNSSYWQGTPYIGVGPSAHSYNGTKREWNISNVKQYIEAIENNLQFSEYEILTTDDCYNEYIMTGLRTHIGCSFDEIKNLFGEKYKNYAKKQLLKTESNLFSLENQIFTLTKIGKHFADGIASKLFI